MISGLRTMTASSAEAVDRISLNLWLVFFLCFLSNLFGGLVSTLMSVYLPMAVTELSGEQSMGSLGDISAIINSQYIFGWTAGGLAWGLISDLIGRVRAFIFTFGLYGLFTLLTSLATSWEMLVIFRLLTGFGVGGVMVVSVTYMSEIWPERTRSIFIGIMSIGFPVGIFSAGLTNYIISDWRMGFLNGMIPLAMALISIAVFRESEIWKNSRIGHNMGLNMTELKQNKKDLLKGSIVFGSMLIGMWAVFSWLPTWMQSILHNGGGQEERGIGMMLMGIGGLTGGFFSGWISNGIGLRKALLICFAGCLSIAIVMFSNNTSFSQVIYLETGVMAIFFGISQGALGAYIPQLFKPGIRATATGFCFNMARLLTGTAVFFIGTLVVSLGGYGNTLLVFSSVFLIGLIAVFYSRDPKESEI